MPYTRVTRTKNGAAAIKYARGEGVGHDGSESRNMYVTGVNMLPDNVVPFEKQMEASWNRMGRRHKVQVDRVIISHSDKELSADKPEDILKAHQIAVELGQALAPGHQVGVFTQIDGKGRKIHSHLLICDAEMLTGKGLAATQYYHPLIRAEADKICTQYFDLANPEAAPERVSQTVRAKRELNEQAVADGRTEDVVYIWQDDLKSRIKKAAEAAKDEQDFYAQLTAHGVEGTYHKGSAKRGEYVTYELTDTTGFQELDKIPANLKGRSYKLGADYGLEHLRTVFKDAAKKGPQKPVEAPQSDFKAEVGSLTAESAKAAPAPSEAEKTPMERAKESARIHITRKYIDVHGGIDYDPRDADGFPDYEARSKQLADANEHWEQFMSWRVQQRKQGQKLGSIYLKKSKDYIAVDYDELDREYTDFQRGITGGKKPEPEAAKAAEPVKPVQKPKADDAKAAMYQKYARMQAALRAEAEREDENGFEMS